MRRDAGVVLINALVVVLAISAVAAAMLTRSETARIRAVNAQATHQLDLYLDAGERLMPVLLQDLTDGTAVHRGQSWASGNLRYPIDRGGVAATLADLQGRPNVNWLMRDDPYVRDLFARVFADLRLPASLLNEITEFVASGGPRSNAAYVARRPAVIPRGGPLRNIVDLREVEGMTPAYFAIVDGALSALPSDTRLNLNTASDAVLKAALAPLPSDLINEILTRTEPIEGMSELRARATEILETEDLDDLPFDYLTFSSRWFEARLTASLDGRTQGRRALFQIKPGEEVPIRQIHRWAVYD